jgi:3D (Asp-Asp-Asp) domain-containing protein
VRRLFGIAAAGAVVLCAPLAIDAAPPTVQSIRARDAKIEHEKRSAILSLYSLDARVTSADYRLATLQRREVALRHQRASAATELGLARADERLSQQQLAQRLRLLYDHGQTSTVDLIFGATSLTEALNQLDNLDRVTSVNEQILGQLESAHRRAVRVKTRLAAQDARLQDTIRSATAEAQSLAAVRSARSAYIGRLSSQQTLDAQAIARLTAQARAAELKTRQMTQRAPAAAIAVPVAAADSTSTGNTLDVVATGYCLTGTTATGIPVGWGVAAVDPGVIPLGTHLEIPGYGEAVAADTGSAIVGGRIDLWFPTCAQAGGWGSRSVRIALH